MLNALKLSVHVFWNSLFDLDVKSIKQTCLVVALVRKCNTVTGNTSLLIHIQKVQSHFSGKLEFYALYDSCCVVRMKYELWVLINAFQSPPRCYWTWLDKVPFIIKTEPMAKLKKVETSLNITDNLTSRAFERNLSPGRRNRVCEIARGGVNHMVDPDIGFAEMLYGTNLQRF